jgi:hypothetical protein
MSQDRRANVTLSSQSKGLYHSDLDGANGALQVNALEGGKSNHSKGGVNENK